MEPAEEIDYAASVTVPQTRLGFRWWIYALLFFATTPAEPSLTPVSAVGLRYCPVAAETTHGVVRGTQGLLMTAINGRGAKRFASGRPQGTFRP